MHLYGYLLEDCKVAWLQGNLERVFFGCDGGRRASWRKVAHDERVG